MGGRGDSTAGRGGEASGGGAMWEGQCGREGGGEATWEKGMIRERWDGEMCEGRTPLLPFRTGKEEGMKGHTGFLTTPNTSHTTGTHYVSLSRRLYLGSTCDVHLNITHTTAHILHPPLPVSLSSLSMRSRYASLSLSLSLSLCVTLSL